MAYDDDHNQPPPRCPSCGADMKCLGCDDTRPIAEDLYQGWLLRSPLDRWETVERVDNERKLGQIQVWTKETGPNYSWHYWRHSKVDAVRPLQHFHGTPEVRIVEHDWHDGPMYAVATLDTIPRPEIMNPLVEARTAGRRGKGWTVAHYPDGSRDLAVVECETKAKARTALRAAARLHAKALGVKLTLPSKPDRS